MRVSPVGLFGAALLTFGAVPAMAADQAMVILDLSGSMSRQAGGSDQSRINLARSTLATALADLPDDLDIGLTLFGHRTPGSCEDIEVVVPPQAGVGRDITSTIRNVRPRGETPIGQSLQASAEALNFTENKATIVLVTDGVGDACTIEFCSVATALEAAGADLTIHVLGLGLSEAAETAFACISNETGGQFFRADDDTEALVAALALAVTPKPPPPPLPVATLDLPAEIGLSEPFTVAYSGPLAEGDQIQIAWPGSLPGQSIRSVFVAADGAPRSLTAPGEQGVYAVRYFLPSRNAVIAERLVMVVPVAVAIDAPASVGQGTDFTVTWRGTGATGDRVEVAEPQAPVGTPISVGDILPHVGRINLDAPIAPGTYEVRYIGGVDGEVLARRPIEIVPVAASLTAPAEAVGGTEIEVGWEGPAAPLDEIQIAAAGDPPGMRVHGARLGRAGALVRLDTPTEGGSFELRYWSAFSNTVLARAPIEIAAASATLDAPGNVEGGANFEIAWSGPAGRFDEIHLAAAGSDPGRSVLSARLGPAGEPVRMTAPVFPGDYELRYWSTEARTALATRALRVDPTEATLTVAAPVQAGGPFSVEWTGPAGRFDEIHVAIADSPGGASIASVLVPPSGEPALLRAPPLPGPYVLRYWSAQARLVLKTIPLTVQAIVAAPSPGAPAPADPAAPAGPPAAGPLDMLRGILPLP